MSDLMRLAGINSGYDSEAMIQEMMSGYQTRIDNQNKKLTKLQWKQEAYRDVITKLSDFQNKYFDILNKSSYLMSPTTFSKFKSNITTKSGEEAKGAIAVTTTANSKVGNHEIQVLQTASKAKLTGAKINPAGFSLDLGKAAESNYKTKTDESSGAVTRSYDFALDVKVGSVSKTVEFKFDIDETDGKIDQDDFAAKLTDALNEQFAENFGFTGRTENTTGLVNADGKEYFLAAEASDDGKTLNFKVGGNAAVSITEKTGNFGLAKPSIKQAIAMQSCVTGTNTVAVTVGDATRNVSFDGVSATYFDSRNEKGNEAILAEYNNLKLEAFKKANNGASPTSDQFESFSYTSTQAAKDKNSAALIEAGNEVFKDAGYTFGIKDGYLSITQSISGGQINKNFSIASVEGGTLGLAKGNATNRISDNLTLKEMGFTNANSGFNINGKTIGVNEDMTIKELLDKVNKSGAGVTMSYSTLENRFIIESNDMGDGGDFEVEDNALTKELGLTASAGAASEAGKNAIFKLDGVEIYHNSNSYEVDGSKLDFTDAVANETYKVGISKDYEEVKTLIKDFVKDYNQLIDDVYGHIGTAPVRDNKNNLYEPLTDAEKEEMDDKEIEKWETTAKKGVLYNDPTISSVLSKIRTALYNTVTTEDGKKFGLYNMGISTMSMLNSSSEDVMRGKLKIDEDKFNEAFDKNPDVVAKLFTDPSRGIMKQIDTIIDDAASSSTNERGAIRGSLVRKAGLEKGTTAKNNEIFRQMEQINKRINTLQDRYDSKEEYWWSVFTNLEKMMGEFNSQSNYMASYLGGGGTMM